MPSQALLEPEYISTRATLIQLGHALGPAGAGNPPGGHARWQRGRSPELPATSHFVAKQLKARGHTVEIGQQNSGLHVIGWRDGELLSGVDPRREGAALGR